MTSSPKPIIGLTGGIASGKSTVAEMLRKLGISVVDADALAREVVLPGREALAEIVQAFGPGVLAADGTLDRTKLGELVFADADARRKLNAITHPRIAELSRERIAAAQETATPYVVYEAALLVESGAHRGLAALVVVALAESLQLARLVARDGLSEQAARERLAAQLPLSAKVQEADYVIANDGDLAALQASVLQTHRAILERFALASAET
jgi:dephospho-CoA kinase